MASTPRTFKVQSPHMTGEDIRGFQRDLNARFQALLVNKALATDGDYGTATRDSAVEVCTVLGIAPDAMQHGVTPELRIKLRHPETRTADEVARAQSTGALDFLAKLRDQFKGGEVIIAPDANKPGRPIQPVTLDYVRRMSGLIHKPITITTGTNHDQFTVNGNVSDHFTGHAADIGMHANGGTDDSPVGDHIMTAGLILAGVASDTARADAEHGGLFTFNHGGLRIQCIWKTLEGGNHHNHVHVGVRPA